MSKFKGIVSLVTDALGMGKQKAPEINIPEAVVPAQPAPTRRETAGADVVLGTDSIKNQRVSGGGKTAKKKGTNVLGGLGGGSGLNI